MTLMTLSTSRLSHVGPLPKLRDAEDLEEKIRNQIICHQMSINSSIFIMSISLFVSIEKFHLLLLRVFFLCLCISSWFFIRLHSTQQLDNSTTRLIWRLWQLPPGVKAWCKTSDENRNSKVEHGVQIWLLEIFEHFRKVCAYLIWSISLNQVGHGYLISKMMQLSLMCLNKIQEIHLCSALWKHNSSLKSTLDASVRGFVLILTLSCAHKRGARAAGPQRKTGIGLGHSNWWQKKVLFFTQVQVSCSNTEFETSFTSCCEIQLSFQHSSFQKSLLAFWLLCWLL